MEEIQFKNYNRANKFTTKFSLFCQAFFSIPKTLFFNLKCFPLSTAVHLPILVSYRTKIIEAHRGMISFNCTPSRFMVKIGFGGSDGIDEKKNYICLEGGCVTFNGKVSFSAGTSIRNAGELIFGANFWSNKNCTIWCSKKIEIGNDVLFGWNIMLRDSDGHLIVDENGRRHPVDGNITIGNHCWICSESHILKNSQLGDECVLGYGSLLTKRYDSEHTLFAGRPAIPKRYNIQWVRGENND